MGLVSRIVHQLTSKEKNLGGAGIRTRCCWVRSANSICGLCRPHCAHFCKTFSVRNSNKLRFSFKFQNALKCFHRWFHWYVPALMSIFDALSTILSIKTQFQFRLSWSGANLMHFFWDGIKSNWQFTYMAAL